MFVKGEHERQFAYEAHTACDSRGFVLEVEVTAGNVHDSVAWDTLYDNVTHKHEVQYVTMDAGYKTPWIAKKTFDDGKVPILPYTRYKGDQDRYKPWEYTYDPANDTYTCPRGGVLRHTTTEEHKTRWFAGAALNTSEAAMQSVMSTAMSRLNAFLDSELEQILCFDTAVDAEKFCAEKCAIFVVLPEENPNTYFLISLLIQQLYREILAVADENGGRLDNRVIIYADEFGSLPKLESAELIFSASRSRRLQIVPCIQSYQQLQKNYGAEGAAIIQDNCQLTIVGGFAPTSDTAEIVSKALGSRTVMTGSVSRGHENASQSLQMTERPLMSGDELKSMKGCACRFESGCGSQ